MNLPADQVELLRCFEDAEVEYLVVGAHALAAHGSPRYTGDLDVWVNPTPDNAVRVFRALATFGAPLAGLRPADFEDPDAVFQIGLPPLRIDILTFLSGLEFGAARGGAIEVDIGGLAIPVLGREHLIQNKLAAGRLRDLADVELLDAERAAEAIRERKGNREG
jgi:hypothetical protein